MLFIWTLREKGIKRSNLNVEYGGTENYFTLRLSYGGIFSKPLGRKYIDGTVSYIDIDLFSVHELNDMVIKLGYQKEQFLYYHYCIPDQPLDFRLMTLGNDSCVLKLIMHVPKFRKINVYIESGETRVFTHFKSPSKLVIEPLEPENDSHEMNVRRPRRKETGSCSRKLRLESPPRSQVYDLAVVPHTNSQVMNDLEKPHTKSGIFLSNEEDLGGSV
ncbi:hypothetical protein LXL04_023611 [Taraxacum kok-saghyz]